MAFDDKNSGTKKFSNWASSTSYEYFPICAKIYVFLFCVFIFAEMSSNLQFAD